MLNSDDVRSLSGRRVHGGLCMCILNGGALMENLAERISDSELEVMRVLWEAGTPLPISDIRIALQQRRGWEPTTVKTLVTRLLSKEVIAQEKRNVFYYRPLLTQEEYKSWATSRLIDKLYRGSARNLVAALVHSDSLSQEDIRELRDFFRMEDEK